MIRPTLLLILICTSIAPAQTPAPKPPIGVPADAKHFNGKWYKVYLEKVPWQRAKEKCAAVGGQLVVVPDAPTWVYVRELANQLTLWLGATDEKTEGLWVWVDGTPMSFKAWGENQPEAGREQDYLFAGTRGNMGAQKDGYDKVVGYICEWKAK